MCAFVLHLQDPCETGTYTREFDNVGRRGHPTPSGSLCRFGRIPRAQHRLIYRSTLTYPCTDFQSLVGFIYSVIVLFEQVAFGAPAVRLHRIKLQSQWRKSRNLIWEILIYGTDNRTDKDQRPLPDLKANVHGKHSMDNRTDKDQRPLPDLKANVHGKHSMKTYLHWSIVRKGHPILLGEVRLKRRIPERKRINYAFRWERVPVRIAHENQRSLAAAATNLFKQQTICIFTYGNQVDAPCHGAFARDNTPTLIWLADMAAKLPDSGIKYSRSYHSVLHRPHNNNAEGKH
ncbi:hypothetical protein QE152_g35936 [Popillia japonica]|uniref:Uncharacterized protein n=1 Tax=Popillia japonica TaxID=7064 RepID=A0AAW1IED4_POPJA